MKSCHDKYLQGLIDTDIDMQRRRPREEVPMRETPISCTALLMKAVVTRNGAFESLGDHHR